VVTGWMYLGIILMAGVS